VVSRDLALVALLAALVWPQRRAVTGDGDITRTGHALTG